MGAVTGAAALILGILPAFVQNPYVYGLIFVFLGFAEAGVLLVRKTFLIDQVDPGQRTTYVAFANTVMGIVTLLFGFAGILAQVYGIQILNFYPHLIWHRWRCCQPLSAGNIKQK